MIALLSKSYVFTAVLWAKVHSHRSFAHAIFDKYYKIPKKDHKKSAQMPEGSIKGLDAENAIEPQ